MLRAVIFNRGAAAHKGRVPFDDTRGAVNHVFQFLDLYTYLPYWGVAKYQLNLEGRGSTSLEGVRLLCLDSLVTILGP